MKVKRRKILFFNRLLPLKAIWPFKGDFADVVVIVLRKWLSYIIYLIRRTYRHFKGRVFHKWRIFWLNRSGSGRMGQAAAWIACRNTGPYHLRSFLADLVPHGFIAPSVRLFHPKLRFGKNVYLGDRVIVYCSNNGGGVVLHDRVQLYGDSFIETGMAGSVQIGEGTHIQPGCHIHAYLSVIKIGKNVEIAPGCGFYCYDHGMALGAPIMEQPLKSKGEISVGDGVWIGHGVTVLQGVTIGEGAVIAAGSVVIHDIPANSIAAGVPARIVKLRDVNN